MTIIELATRYARMNSYYQDQCAIGFTKGESVARTARKFDTPFTEVERILGVTV